MTPDLDGFVCIIGTILDPLEWRTFIDKSGSFFSSSVYMIA